MIYVDMDGVVADFDTHYVNTIGPLPPRSAASRDVDWARIAHGNWWAGIPLMHDAMMLWEYVARHKPTFLTGVPSTGRRQAESNKKDWIARKFGPHVPVITTSSSRKCEFCKPGDILIDDWEKYRHKWIDAGGTWITHKSAADTIKILKKVGI